MRPSPLPVLLDLDGRDVLVVGGGTVATRRVDALLAAGARVRVVSPTLSPALRAHHADGRVAWEARAASPGDVRGAALVVVACDDHATAAAVAAAARGSGALLNDAVEPARGDLAVAAALRRGEVVVGVGTQGASPVLSAYLRDRVAEALGPEVAGLVPLAARLRGVPPAAARAAIEEAHRRLCAGDREGAEASVAAVTVPAGTAAWS